MPDGSLGNCVTTKGGTIKNSLLQGFRKIKFENKNIWKGIFVDGILQEGTMKIAISQEQFQYPFIVKVSTKNGKREEKREGFQKNKTKIELIKENNVVIKSVVSMFNGMKEITHYSGGKIKRKEYFLGQDKPRNTSVEINDITSSTATILFEKCENKNTDFYTIAYFEWSTTKLEPSISHYITLSKGDISKKYSSYSLSNLKSKTKYGLLILVHDRKGAIIGKSNTRSFDTL